MEQHRTDGSDIPLLYVVPPAAEARMTPTEVIAEVEWLVGTDSPESIVRRLGYKNLASFERWLLRQDRLDLVHRLMPLPLDPAQAAVRLGIPACFEFTNRAKHRRRTAVA